MSMIMKETVDFERKLATELMNCVADQMLAPDVDSLIVKVMRDEGMPREHSFLVELGDERRFRISVERV